MPVVSQCGVGLGLGISCRTAVGSSPADLQYRVGCCFPFESKRKGRQIFVTDCYFIFINMRRHEICMYVYTDSDSVNFQVMTITREVRLIRLPSDSIADRGHISLIINRYYAICTDK